jgi:RNA polymerase sigma factor (sigma-70 family)
MEDKNYFFKAVKEKMARKVRHKKFAGIDNEDVVGDILLKIVKMIGHYDSSKSQIQTYVDRIAESVIKDVLKHIYTEKHQVRLNGTEFSVSLSMQSEDGYGYRETMTDIKEFSGLTAFDKEILDLKVEGYIFDEIAEKLGCSKSKVAYTWKAIVKKLEELEV